MAEIRIHSAVRIGFLIVVIAVVLFAWYGFQACYQKVNRALDEGQESIAQDFYERCAIIKSELEGQKYKVTADDSVRLVKEYTMCIETARELQNR